MYRAIFSKQVHKADIHLKCFKEQANPKIIMKFIFYFTLSLFCFKYQTKDALTHKLHYKTYIFDWFLYLFILVPKMPPEGVECQGVTSAGIELKWDLISSENLRGKLSSYKIHYQEVSSLDLKDSK